MIKKHYGDYIMGFYKIDGEACEHYKCIEDCHEAAREIATDTIDALCFSSEQDDASCFYWTKNLRNFKAPLQHWVISSKDGIPIRIKNEDVEFW
jgi:hypothetical protein